jgi:RND family efflux transporter MFP subunit
MKIKVSCYLLLIGGVVIVSGCNKQAIPPAPTPVVRIATVTLEGHEQALSYSASVEPYTHVDLAFRTGGYVVHMAEVEEGKHSRLLEPGDYVVQRQVLAELRQADYEHQVSEAEAELAQAKAQQADSDADFQRTSALFDQDAVTRTTYDSQKARCDTARAAVDNATAALQQARLTLGDATLRAPQAGLILARNIDVGSLVAPGTVAYTIVDLRSVKFVFGLPDSLLKSIQFGQSLNIDVQSLHRTFSGLVTGISPSADVHSRVFSVEVTVQNPGATLRPGMIGTVTLNQAPDPLPSVPLAAIAPSRSTPNGFAVWVITGNAEKQTVHLQDVNVGPTHDNLISVQGLSLGQRVVVSGPILAEGDQVQVIP